MTMIPTGHQAPAPTTLVCPPTLAPVPAPFAPPSLQPPVGGPPPADRVTAYAVAYGGSATAYAVASLPAVEPVTLQAAPRRSWRTAALVVAALAVTAVGCGVLAVDYPSLVRVWQVASYVSTVAGAAAALVTLVGWRKGAGTRQ